MKFTDPEWKNAAVAGESIRIGSVLYYREIKDPSFRDTTEGEGPVVYKSKAPLDAETHNRIFQGEGYALNNKWKIQTNGIPLISSPSTFNPFIYSCSLVRRKSEIPKLAKRFDKRSWYFISDVWRFANCVSEALRAEILKTVEEDEGAKLPDSVSSKLETLELLPVIGKITYTDASKEKIVDENNSKVFDPYKVQLEPYFRKPTSFSDDKEFRMIWVPNLGSIEKDNFDITTTTIKHLDLALENHRISARARPIKEIVNKRGVRIA